MSEDDPTQEEIDMKRLQDAAEGLGEHFETVQIFVTRYNDDGEHGTVNAAYGTGNWFARYGQIASWVVRTDEDSRIERRNANDE